MFDESINKAFAFKLHELCNRHARCCAADLRGCCPLRIFENPILPAYPVQPDDIHISHKWFFNSLSFPDPALSLRFH